MAAPSLAERLAALAKWEAVFTAPAFTVGTWSGGEADADGVIQMPWFDYSPAVLAFVAEASANGWVRPFDWGRWLATPAARRLIADPGLVATASADDLARLLTAIVRSDRFSEGEIAGAFASGLILAIVRRAAALLPPP